MGSVLKTNKDRPCPLIGPSHYLECQFTLKIVTPSQFFFVTDYCFVIKVDKNFFVFRRDNSVPPLSFGFSSSR